MDLREIFSSFYVLAHQEFAFFWLLLMMRERGPRAFGFTCSCAKQLMGIIDNNKVRV